MSVAIDKGNGGFSLIELSIALLILGLLTLPLAEAYKHYRYEKAIKDTQARRTLIQSALGAYYTQNRQYPLPALPSLAPGNQNYGKEQRGLPLQTQALNTCAGGGCRANGKDADGDGTPDPVLIGAVPFATLNLPPESAMDGWGNQFTYAVTQSMTSQASFDQNMGAINVNTYTWSDYIAGNNNTPVATTGNYHIVIMSHGSDGMGAYNMQGLQATACPTTGVLPADAENCDGDAVFFDPTQSCDPLNLAICAGAGTAAGLALHYDDIPAFIQNIPTSIWDDQTVQNGDIKTIQHIGIGTEDVARNLHADGSDDNGYDSQIALDVSGNIGADRVLAGNLCDRAGDSCFGSKVLAGTGYIDCSTPAGGGTGYNSSVMSGIGGAIARCKASLPRVSAGSCPAGQYMTGFNTDGSVKCQAF